MESSLYLWGAGQKKAQKHKIICTGPYHSLHPTSPTFHLCKWPNQMSHCCQSCLSAAYNDIHPQHLLSLQHFASEELPEPEVLSSLPSVYFSSINLSLWFLMSITSCSREFHNLCHIVWGIISCYLPWTFPLLFFSKVLILLLEKSLKSCIVFCRIQS